MVGTVFSPLKPIPIQGQQTSYSLINPGKNKFRFLHIPSLLKEQKIAIFETDEIPKNEYACISYPWSGLSATVQPAVIVVAGLKSEDAISIPILTTICAAANKMQIDYIWLDKLCIRQDEGDIPLDKNFQLPHMYNIYASCKVCLVTPGGMFRLPEIDESTTWIDRAWTLQEALAPQDVQVLFSWKHGPKTLQHTGFTIVNEAVPGVGVAPLKGMLECNLKSEVSILSLNEGDREHDPQTCQVKLLTGRDESGFGMKALLGAIDHTEDDGRLNAIWRCLIMRSARSKEDLIFSSMGIMGVTVTGEGINPGTDYSDIEVTDLLIRYIKAISAKNRRAEWLGIAPSLGTAVGYSGLPTLPLARNVGRGFINVNGRIFPHPDVAEDGWWSLSGAPKVTVHDTADLSFVAKYVPVIETQEKLKDEGYTWEAEYPDDLINRSTNMLWTVAPDLKDGKSFALDVGAKVYYVNGNFPMINDEYTTLLMLVTEFEPGRYRNMGYAWGLQNSSKDWQERKFRIGG